MDTYKRWLDNSQIQNNLNIFLNIVYLLEMRMLILFHKMTVYVLSFNLFFADNYSFLWHGKHPFSSGWHVAILLISIT